MGVRRFDAPGLSEPPGYSHVATGSGRLVFTAGAVPLDADGNLVGHGDHRAQAEQILRNLEAALVAAGAGSDDVAKTTVYVVGDHDAHVAVWDVVRSSAVGRAPSTLLGVQLLGYRGQLVEIEAIAIVPDDGTETPGS